MGLSRNYILDKPTLKIAQSTCPMADSGSNSERSCFPKAVLLWSAWRSSAHALKILRAALPRDRSKNSKQINCLRRRQSACADVQPHEWACLFGGNADSAQRQRNGVRTLCPFLSEGYKRGIQWPKKVNENGRFSLVNAGIAQLVEQLICNLNIGFCYL